MAAVIGSASSPTVALAQVENQSRQHLPGFVLEETCPTSMRPFVKAYLHAWLFMTLTVTVLLTPTMTSAVDFLIAIFCVLFFLGLILLK